MKNKVCKHIGLVGCGRWGRYILRDLKSLNCNVSVVARSNQSIANAKEYEADHIVQTIPDMELESIDGFIVASPTSTHFKVIEQIAFFGKPIFTEKSLTSTTQTAHELVEKYGDFIFVMDKWKYHNGIKKLKEMINTGDFGKVKQVVLRRNQWSSPHVDVDPVWILIPHDISIAQYLLDSTPSAVFAVGNECRDDFFMSLHATLKTNDTQVLIEVAGDAVITERSVRVVCEKGSLALANSNSNHILVHRDSDVFGAQPMQVGFEPNMPLLDELSSFVAYLSDSTIDLHSTAQQGFENVKLIGEIRKLAKK